MDELLELGKELGAEAVVLAGTDTARLAAGDRNGGDILTYTRLLALLRIRNPGSGAFLAPGSGIRYEHPRSYVFPRA
jgi:hypothetical protein